MTERLTEKQMLDLVAEVERLNQRRDGEYDRAQVSEILREMNLPTQLVDEALVQLERRQALEVQQKRRRLILGGGAFLAAAAVAGVVFWAQQGQQKLDRVAAQAGEVAPAPARPGQQITYRVTLGDAPRGERLSLRCDWADPRGRVVHQNRFQTRTIDRDIWPTACRYTPPASTPPGDGWKVTMSLPDRVLDSRPFEVR